MVLDRYFYCLDLLNALNRETDVVTAGDFPSNEIVESHR